MHTVAKAIFAIPELTNLYEKIFLGDRDGTSRFINEFKRKYLCLFLLSGWKTLKKMNRM
jgi:hypothetical protein